MIDWVCFKCGKPIIPTQHEIDNYLMSSVRVNNRRFHTTCYTDLEIVKYAADHGLLKEEGEL